jgi:hypothetical protein
MTCYQSHHCTLCAVSSCALTCALVPALLARMGKTLPALSSSMPGSQHRSHTLVVWEWSTEDRYLQQQVYSVHSCSAWCFILVNAIALKSCMLNCPALL